MSEKFYYDWINTKKISPIVITGIGQGIIRRIFEALTLERYDLIWIHRQTVPVFHKFFDRLFENSKIPIVFDMDDAVFTEYPIDILLRSSVGATVGNQYLARYVETVAPNLNILVLPTVLDTKYYTSILKDASKKPVVGWIGSSATFKRYLLPILDDIMYVCRSSEATLEIIASPDTAEAVQRAGAIFIPWSLESELIALQNFDIGLMPLDNDNYSLGKCAFKLIEYGAVGIPSIGTRIGANEEVITDGITGYLTDDLSEMQDRLKSLISDFNLRCEMGLAARRKIEVQYSLESKTNTLAVYFRQILENHAKF